MSSQLPAWTFFLFMAMGFLWLSLGAYEALSSCRSNMKEGKSPDANGSSIAFSAGAAYGIFIAVWGLMEGHHIPGSDLVQIFAKSHLIATCATVAFLFLMLWWVCELLLRKIVRYDEPSVIF